MKIIFTGAILTYMAIGAGVSESVPPKTNILQYAFVWWFWPLAFLVELGRKLGKWMYKA